MRLSTIIEKILCDWPGPPMIPPGKHHAFHDAKREIGQVLERLYDHVPPEEADPVIERFVKTVLEKARE